jgi:nitrous oxidase accessory protein NosD
MGALVLTGTMLATAAPIATAASHACRVTNLESGITVGSIQRAVRAASAGDRLVVKGTCRGVAKIGKDLHIRGVRTATAGRPVLDGAGAGPVLTVKARASVTLRDLTIRHGAAPRGGGIYNRGTLVLRDVIVRASTATELGGGIWNHTGAILKLRGSSVVRGNTSASGAVASPISAASG